jgi:hypothetical protein
MAIAEAPEDDELDAGARPLGSGPDQVTKFNA